MLFFPAELGRMQELEMLESVNTNAISAEMRENRGQANLSSGY